MVAMGEAEGSFHVPPLDGDQLSWQQWHCPCSTAPMAMVPLGVLPWSRGAWQELDPDPGKRLSPLDAAVSGFSPLEPPNKGGLLWDDFHPTPAPSEPIWEPQWGLELCPALVGTGWDNPGMWEWPWMMPVGQSSGLQRSRCSPAFPSSQRMLWISLEAPHQHAEERQQIPTGICLEGLNVLRIYRKLKDSLPSVRWKWHCLEGEQKLGWFEGGKQLGMNQGTGDW